MHSLLSTFILSDLKALGKSRNIATNTATKVQLILRLQKHATQAVVYDGRPVRHLLRDIHARGIGFPNATASDHLIALLEAADRARTFHPFLDLPAELRNMVYCFAVGADEPLKVGECRARVPVVCQVSRQLRDESLPILGGSPAWV
ncbi:hypothetical protein B0A55_04000 [Friedmanniomyces simplex]|uniref:Uncharacterized protein n=1 Tax=Friedmanniomyces simplex TaxID=329884 RepID=A0A4U0XQR0_9PEZI|nr:hypothetical protein B0A55_04000 [Friedmanniomyces simplex]